MIISVLVVVVIIWFFIYHIFWLFLLLWLYTLCLSIIRISTAPHLSGVLLQPHDHKDLVFQCYYCYLCVFFSSKWNPCYVTTTNLLCLTHFFEDSIAMRYVQFTHCVNPPFRLVSDWIGCVIWTSNINEWIHEIPFMHYSSTMFCHFVPLNISFNLNENNMTMNKHVHPMWGYINSLLCIYSPFQICPICAALPGGDPNHVTDDFAAHLTLEHRAPRDLISFYLILMCICPSIFILDFFIKPFHSVFSLFFT